MTHPITVDNVDVDVDVELGTDEDVWLTLSYPKSGPIRNIMIDLSDTRAAMPLKVSFNHERDGWVVEQAQGSDDECNWEEVAFIKGIKEE